VKRAPPTPTAAGPSKSGGCGVHRLTLRPLVPTITLMADRKGKEKGRSTPAPLMRPSGEQLREQVEATKAATLDHLRTAVSQTTEAEEQGQEGLECVLRRV
jgi:hypothetical protein